jgi:hypothetical protein
MVKDKSNKISDTERYHLDAYGFAQLAKESPRAQMSGMRAMYGILLDKADPVISSVLYQAEVAKKYHKAKMQYDSASKEDREKFKLKDPGKPSQELTESFRAVMEASELYTGKRQEIMAGMTVAQMLAYNSNTDEKPIVAMPENIEKLLKGNSTQIAKLGKDNKSQLIMGAIATVDGYRIHGILNSQVESMEAQRRLEMMSAGLEKLASEEAKKTKSN